MEAGKNGKKNAIRSVICIVLLIVIWGGYFITVAWGNKKFDLAEDDFSCAYQIENVEQKDGKLVLTGWAFKLKKDSAENEIELILYDEEEEKGYFATVKKEVREDVNKYFFCEYDYSKSGFVAEVPLKKLDLENRNYKILLRLDRKHTKKAYATNVYLSKGEVMYANPAWFEPLKVEGTYLEEIVENGMLRVYRPDVGMHVYQYNGMLYWIAEKHFFFKEDGHTYIQFQLNTTQISNLPQQRLENKWYSDNIGFYFEAKEVVGMNTGNYRVAVVELPKTYSITQIWTGYHDGEWIWRQDFRPWYDFSNNVED